MFYDILAMLTTYGLLMLLWFRIEAELEKRKNKTHRIPASKVTFTRKRRK